MTLAAAGRLPDHLSVVRRSGRLERAPALLIAALALLGWRSAEARPPGPSRLPPESPLYGAPYRNGPGFEVATGLALCMPGLAYQGVCAGDGGAGPRPGLALRLGLGWRLNQHLWLSGAWARQMHRPGGAFVSGKSDAFMLAARGIVTLPPRLGPAAPMDLGFELGLGYSQRSYQREEAPFVLRSAGAVVRPAIILEGWVLADLALGVELAGHVNLHWRHCADMSCQVAPGPWVGGGLEQRWVDGFTIAVRATGLLAGIF